MKKSLCDFSLLGTPQFIEYDLSALWKKIKPKPSFIKSLQVVKNGLFLEQVASHTKTQGSAMQKQHIEIINVSHERMYSLY